jgi:hypothetical protein
MRTDIVAILLPFCQLDAGMAQQREQCFIETFITQVAIEAFL